MYCLVCLIPFVISLLMFVPLLQWIQNHRFIHHYQNVTSSSSINSFLWPYPSQIDCLDNAQVIPNNVVQYTLMQSNLFPNAEQILKPAFEEYYDIIFKLTTQIPDSPRPNSTEHELKLDFLQLNVTLLSDDVRLSFDTKEDYKLSIDYPVSNLTASTVYGALRGLETFSQLVLARSDGKLYLHQCDISDSPFFKHRGILYDTSRHFLPVSLLKKQIQIMSWNKFNVFHWHIVDLQAFPYVSETFPELSAKGAYSPRHTYSKADVQEVIRYANRHGVRVMVEFDTPGHTAAWGKGAPGLLTPCYTDGERDGTYGPINAISNVTWPFLSALFAEIVGDFRDQYIHLGGDEVGFSCWASNPRIQEWMEERGYTNYARFEEFYIGKLLQLVERLNRSYVVWQEVFDNGNKIKDDTIIHVWKGGNSWASEMNKVTKAGYHALLSSCWYLDRISLSPDYFDYFRCDPLNFGGTKEQQELVMGGEAAIWGELVDGTNSLSRTWPRAAAAGERLWSGASTVNTSNSEVYDRLHKHRCRLLNRGVPAQPLGPGYCSYPWDPILPS